MNGKANAAGGEPATQADDSQEDRQSIPRDFGEPWRYAAHFERKAYFIRTRDGLHVGTVYAEIHARRIVAAINMAGAARATTEQIETIAMRWMGQGQTS